VCAVTWRGGCSYISTKS